MKNFELLASTYPNKTIMPVVHGRTIAEIEFSVELLAERSDSLTWIGLGGIVPLLQHRFVSKDISKIGPEIFISRRRFGTWILALKRFSKFGEVPLRTDLKESVPSELMQLEKISQYCHVPVLPTMCDPT